MKARGELVIGYWLIGGMGIGVGKLGALTDYTDYADFFMLMIGGFSHWGIGGLELESWKVGGSHRLRGSSLREVNARIFYLDD
ncbi:hypothetical protein SAMN06295967_101252 [Belliella buryatensis]|uniref:Uncharacterized protein n=1 Tax=Belliella buryatensis TaxID=1500549 RepID=A0A239ALB8_9BACT|nr:hypothetical protein SAMN06295967_101252 [Belliella buryatensis]